MQCKNCKFAEKIPLKNMDQLNSNIKLECRRYPPISVMMPVQLPGGNMSIATGFSFPSVTDDTYCGEFFGTNEVIS